MGFSAAIDSAARVMRSYLTSPGKGMNNKNPLLSCPTAQLPHLEGPEVWGVELDAALKDEGEGEGPSSCRP